MSEDFALIDSRGSTNEAGEPAQPDSSATAAGKPTRTDWAGELRGILWLILAVLGFHSFIAKPFYIPSESMLPGLLVGDQLVVSKYPYGWSFVSPTIPDPVAIFESWVLRQQVDSLGWQLPHMSGRLFGRLPERGDVVIVTPPGTKSDYIKRLIGLPGDRIAVRGGVVILNGVPLKRGPLHYVDIPSYGGAPLVSESGVTCDPLQYPGAMHTGADGRSYCRLPLYTETMPNGRHYETVDLESDSPTDNFAEITIPPGHVFMMGDNRDRSADSRVSLQLGGLGGPVPWEYLGGRAEFITFSKTGLGSWNPLTWDQSFRGRRAGTSLHPASDK